MGKKENRPDACTASGTANSIYKDFSTDAPDIQLRRSVANFLEIVKGFGMFPNKIFQKVSKD